MSATAASLTAAFLAGILGSAHCLGMCAGLSGALALRSAAAGAAGLLPFALATHLGRLTSYGALGFGAAAAGGGLVEWIPIAAAPIRVLAGLLIVLIGLSIAFGIGTLAPVESAGARLWRRLSPLARRVLPVTTVPRALGLGLLWGFLPCGLVYSVLLVAATAGRALEGLLIMLAFGAGTVPAMLASGFGAARLAGLVRRRPARLAFGLFVAALGLLTVAMPMAAWLVSGGHVHA